MTLNRDRIGALLFLSLSIAYLILSRDIELYPGDEFEPITARTFPMVIGAAGIVISTLTLILPTKAADRLPLAQYDWIRVAALLGLMIAYGLTIKSAGFLISTGVFLALGYRLLGEKRWGVVLGASLPVAAAFQYILHGLLGIYIQDPLLKALGVIS